MSLKKYAFIAATCLSILFFSCENQIPAEEADSGDSLLTLHRNYSTALDDTLLAEDDGTATQWFNANMLFKVKKNPFKRPGYQFLGWTERENSSIVMYDDRSEMSFRESKDLYAVWELQHYTITYKTNGGKRIVQYPETFTVREGTTLNPVRNGKFVFGGWYDTEDFSGNPSVSIPTGTIGNKTFYARWLGKITYHLNGGTLTVSDTDPTAFLAAETSEDTAPTEATEAESETTSDETYLADDDALLAKGADTFTTEATDETDTFDTFPLAEAEQEADSAVNEASEDEPLSELGAKTETDDQTETDTDAVADEDLTAAEDGEVSTTPNAEQTEAPLIVAGEDLATQYYTVLTDIALPIPEPTDENHLFDGWYYDAAFEKRADSVLVALNAANLDLYAKWNEIKEYTITYELNGGENAEENPAVYKNAPVALALADPTRYGYEFAGWYESADFSGKAVSGIAAFVTGDKTFFAKWERATFTLTYNEGTAEDGKLPKPQVVRYEGEAVIAANSGKLSREGCEFIGWTIENGPDVVSPGDTYIVTENVTLYPVWRLVTYINKEEVYVSKNEKVILKNNQLTHVTIPEAVRELGDGVFADFTALKTIDLAGITTIGKQAFKNCTSLTEVDLTDVTNIKDAAFAQCKTLSRVTLPETPFAHSGKKIFAKTPLLTTLTVPESTEKAFDGWKNLLTAEIVGKTGEEDEPYAVVLSQLTVEADSDQ